MFWRVGAGEDGSVGREQGSAEYGRTQGEKPFYRRRELTIPGAGTRTDRHCHAELEINSITTLSDTGSSIGISILDRVDGLLFFLSLVKPYRLQ
jgi:hypothetical protein